MSPEQLGCPSLEQVGGCGAKRHTMQVASALDGPRPVGMHAEEEEEEEGSSSSSSSEESDVEEDLEAEDRDLKIVLTGLTRLPQRFHNKYVRSSTGEAGAAPAEGSEAPGGGGAAPTQAAAQEQEQEQRQG